MEDELETAGRIISRRLFGNPAKRVEFRLLKSRLRQIGDDVGEPLISDNIELPKNFLSLKVPIVGGGSFEVAMSRTALEKILGRG